MLMLHGLSQGGALVATTGSGSGTTTTTTTTSPYLTALRTRLMPYAQPTATTGTIAPQTTGYSCGTTSCTGYGDTATLFQHLRALCNQAASHVGDVGQPAPIAIKGAIDGDVTQAVWWLHNSTYPQLFPELNAASATGDFRWIAANAAALVADLQAFLATFPQPAQASTSTSIPPLPDPGPPSPSPTGQCDAQSAWDPVSQSCQVVYTPPTIPAVPPKVTEATWSCPAGQSVQPTMVPYGPGGSMVPDRDHPSCQPTPGLKAGHTLALTIGGILAGVALAFFHR